MYNVHDLNSNRALYQIFVHKLIDWVLRIFHGEVLKFHWKAVRAWPLRKKNFFCGFPKYLDG